ncbi:carbohydrate ABC transporter permease [Naasia aerilata]|uniref:Sugar ABC transporter permease n=1 Tax=Naasia aerilata TaxID=1162966 RepID=A0ABN6XKT3_9MICO|nr:sugar ABC transporter permease [Naasia aerilata]BDZ45461.1 sugar ABC transporter permease [Naasia aerilata]
MTSTLSRSRQAPPAPRPTAPAPQRLTFRQRLNRWDVLLSPYLYVSPFFLLFALVGLFPLGYTLVVSLNDWNLLTGPGEWVGLGNFTAELADPLFWNSLFNTMSIFVISAVPQLVLGLVIAAVLDQNLRAKTFWRMSVLLPYVVTPVAVALIFSNMFGEKYGLVNNLLVGLGLDPVMWKTELWPSHFAIAAMVDWRWTGYNALILLAAMQAVPKDIHESAAIDGAGAVRRFFSITIPSIRPTLIFVVITMTIGSLQIFAEPKLFNATTATPGGPHREYQTTVLYLWDLAFQRQSFGKAAAVAWLLFLLIVIIGLVNFLLSQRIASGSSPRERRRGRRAPEGRDALTSAPTYAEIQQRGL